MIELIEVKAKQQQLLWNIHQKYLYEMTNYYDDVMDESGNYHYGYFERNDEQWELQERYAH